MCLCLCVSVCLCGSVCMRTPAAEESAGGWEQTALPPKSLSPTRPAPLEQARSGWARELGPSAEGNEEPWRTLG